VAEGQRHFCVPAMGEFPAMIIGVAGPYSAPDSEQRQKNLDALNRSAARLLVLGHTPIVGVNAALPVLEKLDGDADNYAAIMDISCAVMMCCEALLMIGESPGALRERDRFLARGLPIYYQLEEVPMP
jgi:hypothetical protein